MPTTVMAAVSLTAAYATELLELGSPACRLKFVIQTGANDMTKTVRIEVRGYT